MDLVHSIEEGVRKLLMLRERPIPEFSLEKRTEDGYLDTLVWDGKRIPIFATHFDPQIRAVARYGEPVKDNCALNGYSFAGSDVSLRDLLFQEVDIAEYMLHSPIVKVMALVNGASANLILTTESGACVNMDVGCTLAPGSRNQCQHRLLTRRGMANDRGVATLVYQHQVYVYSEDATAPITYDDMALYLAGLSETEHNKALAVHAVLTEAEDWSGWSENEARYRQIVNAIFEASETGVPVYL